MKRLYLKIALLSILGMWLLAACSLTPGRHITTILDDVENYINERPDSALKVLQGVDSASLTTRALRARFSLLRTMVQAKNYRNLSDPGFIDAAAAWYENHGSPDERMKTLYYQGCIAQANKDLNNAAVFYARAEEHADRVTDQHALALLYLAEASVYNAVYNVDQEEKYARKALAVFRGIGDPMQGAAVGELALVFHSRREWEKADSLYRMAIAQMDPYPHTKSVLLSNYARMKLLQPEKDPAGAIELLNERQNLTGRGITPQEAGVYAYAAGMLGDKKTEEALLSRLRGMTGESRRQVLVWLYRIALYHNETNEALALLQETRYQEDETIKNVLSDSVSASLQSYNEERAEFERNRRWREVSFLTIILLLIAIVAFVAIYHKRRVEVERDGLLRISSSLEKEMKVAQEQNKQQQILLGERAELLSEGERKLDQIKKEFNRERMMRFRQAGNIGSIILLKEKNRISDAAAWRLLRKDLVYIHHLDKNGAELIRRMDQELDGVISRLRKDLHLIGKPQEMMFLCCCILDMDTQVMADLTGMKTMDAVYKRRSRLKAKVLALNKQEYNILFKEKAER